MVDFEPGHMSRSAALIFVGAPIWVRFSYQALLVCSRLGWIWMGCYHELESAEKPVESPKFRGVPCAVRPDFLVVRLCRMKLWPRIWRHPNGL